MQAVGINVLRMGAGRMNVLRMEVGRMNVLRMEAGRMNIFRMEAVRKNVLRTLRLCRQNNLMTEKTGISLDRFLRHGRSQLVPCWFPGVC